MISLTFRAFTLQYTQLRKTIAGVLRGPSDSRLCQVNSQHHPSETVSIRRLGFSSPPQIRWSGRVGVPAGERASYGSSPGSQRRPLTEMRFGESEGIIYRHVWRPWYFQKWALGVDRKASVAEAA